MYNPKTLLTLVVAFLAATAIAAPTGADDRLAKRFDKESIKKDREAISRLNGTKVDPNLKNGTILLDNGEGRCVAVSGTAVCNGISG
ncbi:hypothetical protein HYALB_00006617 [Hymenoscyphus albidus]|uniref:Uncharacterized protein n=1 Tax=Hymenoscyphus albidus TaxID=595503 RepID=A0A9N9LQR8_9HELO|nr:hypothetical protein HYALB_00006617 [Hymenoscyphus albidus]